MRSVPRGPARGETREAPAVGTGWGRGVVPVVTFRGPIDCGCQQKNLRVGRRTRRRSASGRRRWAATRAAVTGAAKPTGPAALPARGARVAAPQARDQKERFRDHVGGRSLEQGRPKRHRSGDLHGRPPAVPGLPGRHRGGTHTGTLKSGHSTQSRSFSQQATCANVAASKTNGMRITAWLRTILAGQLALIMRRFLGTAARDVRLERQIERDLGSSSQALDMELMADGSTPSQGAAGAVPCCWPRRWSGRPRATARSSCYATSRGWPSPTLPSASVAAVTACRSSGCGR